MQQRPRLLALAAIVLLLAAAAPAAVVPPGGPSPAEAKRIESLVDRAAARVAELGEKAFPEFRVRGSAWFNAHTYVFVDDLRMVSRVNGPRPQLEGRNVMDLKDASGRAFHRDWLPLLETSGSAWVSYLWPRPGHAHPSRKWTYIRKVPAGGETYIVGAGVYEKEKK
jgi:methyl-accepting chemotaxis protein